ncbi:MAG: YdiY family protein [Pseudomonadales bacterium]
MPRKHSSTPQALEFAKSLKLWFCVLAASVAGSAVAEAADDGPWSGKVRLGYLATTGNSETTNMNFATSVGYATGAWTHGLAASAIGANDDEQTTAEAYTLGFRSTYDFSEFDYAFGRADWLKDKFSGYDQQLSQAVGYGRRLINSPQQKLNLELGAGARQAELRDGETQSDVIARFGADYQYLINDHAEFNFNLGVQTGKDNTFSEAVSAMKTNLFGSLAAVVAYTVRNNSDVPAGSKKTDGITSISLEYAF